MSKTLWAGMLNANASRSLEISTWLKARQEEMAALLAELVAIPTENPPGNTYRACTDLLELRLQQFGLDCKRIAPAPARNHPEEAPASLMATYGSGERTLYFHGHYDVVPAQSPEQFQPWRKDNFLFGRGSCDMKGGIVAMIYAILAIRACNADLGGRIALMLVPDEETGGRRGSAWLAQEGLLGQNGAGMLLAEPTNGVVWNANRGAIAVRVGVLGKSAHVGLQHQGANAFERMHAVVARLQEWKQVVEQRTTQYEVGTGQLPNSILMLGGQSGGGTNFNVVPDECWFTIDRRINPEENLAEEKASLLGVLEECKQAGIPLEWEVLQEAPSAACGTGEPLGVALARNVQAVSGKAAAFEMCPGLLETRFYAQAGIPAYAYGPGLLAVAHGPNEYVDLRKVVDCAAIYALTAMDMLKA
ncbi:MAG TPA: ArgE/DapE family deacylase [Candidatus Limnocylindrales bacterium]|nr:ArgE/DapE family deacylase [Candidatus Limnocylindrales bacterium]